MIQVTTKPFGRLPQGQQVTAYTLTNTAGLAVTVLDYGGIIINESPATHVPNSPFGGIKDSGSGGKESPYDMICEMTDVKTVVIRKFDC